MLRIKNIMQKGEQKAPHNKSTNPWLIEKVKNGLKAVNVKELTDYLRPLKIPIQYYENDRIYGRGAYADDGVLKVMTMFDELREITPMTKGYIFERKQYYYHNGGILRTCLRTKDEEFFSERTLRNECLDNFLKLTHQEIEADEQEPENDEYTDRETIYNSGSELETT